VKKLSLFALTLGLLMPAFGAERVVVIEEAYQET
jgi:hypothetical protein